jgi:hypothetical protein
MYLTQDPEPLTDVSCYKNLLPGTYYVVRSVNSQVDITAPLTENAIRAVSTTLTDAEFFERTDAATEKQIANITSMIERQIGWNGQTLTPQTRMIGAKQVSFSVQDQLDLLVQSRATLERKLGPYKVYTFNIA